MKTLHIHRREKRGFGYGVVKSLDSGFDRMGGFQDCGKMRENGAEMRRR